MTTTTGDDGDGVEDDDPPEVADDNDGTFWMCFDDFKARFVSVSVCMAHVPPASQRARRRKKPQTWPAELEHRYYAHLLQRGVVVPGLHIFFLSDAHSDDDVAQVIDAFQESFRALRAEGRI